jgi:hypothetical protein
MKENNRFLNESEVANITGLSIQTLRNWRFQGKNFAYSKAGRAVRYCLEDVLAFMESRKIQPNENIKSKNRNASVC